MLVMSTITVSNGPMKRNLDVGLLRTFAAVADRHSMTAAADALHLTQGAVSQRIARLEDFAGGPLLDRDRRGLPLTPSGERLLGKARRLLALNDEIWTDINGGAVDGPVRLGVPPDLVASCLGPVLKTFAEAHPQVELSLTVGASSELTDGLAAGRLDLAVIEEPVAVASGECLMVDRLVWVGAKGGTAFARTPLPLSMVAERCAFRPAVTAALSGRRTRIVFETGGLDATLAAVRMDLAISAWLAATIPPDLAVLPPEAGLPDLPVFAVTLHGPDRPASLASAELARHVRDGLGRQRRPA